MPLGLSAPHSERRLWRSHYISALRGDGRGGHRHHEALGGGAKGLHATANEADHPYDEAYPQIHPSGLLFVSVQIPQCSQHRGVLCMLCSALRCSVFALPLVVWFNNTTLPVCCRGVDSPFVGEVWAPARGLLSVRAGQRQQRHQGAEASLKALYRVCAAHDLQMSAPHAAGNGSKVRPPPLSLSVSCTSLDPRCRCCALAQANKNPEIKALERKNSHIAARVHLSTKTTKTLQEVQIARSVPARCAPYAPLCVLVTDR